MASEDFNADIWLFRRSWSRAWPEPAYEWQTRGGLPVVRDPPLGAAVLGQPLWISSTLLPNLIGVACFAKATPKREVDLCNYYYPSGSMRHRLIIVAKPLQILEELRA